MSNGSGQAESAAPARDPSFFERTENNYRNMETRAREASERIDTFCDQINGGQPREALNTKVEQDRHPAAYDRCNSAEGNMYGAMNTMEESIQRLETLGRI